jgi:hypothetical protein
VIEIKLAMLVKHLRSLSREEIAERSEEAGFLTDGSSPDISPSPTINEWLAFE